MRSSVRLAFLPLLLGALASACGQPEVARDPCAGRACLSVIETDADFDSISLAVPAGGDRCDLARETKFLAPAVDGTALDRPVFQDVNVHRYHLGFMQTELAEYFGGITLPVYAELVQRRATRQYWAGTLVRVVDAQGVPVGYGFDVIVDPTNPEEQLTAEEITAVRDRLRQAFMLPLGYAPRDPQAIARAGELGLPFTVHLPRACGGGDCDDPASYCITAPAPTALCGHFLEQRTIQVEHARKVRLTMAAGAWTLPRTGAVDVTLFDGGAFGPDATPLVPSGPGRFEGGTAFSLYEQTLVAGTETVNVRWEIPLTPDRPGFVAGEPWQYTAVLGTVGTSTAYEDVLYLGSCLNEDLSLYEAVGTLAGGDGFRIAFRYQPPFAGTGPKFVTHAEVTLGGQTVAVDDYFRLVYAGGHHNWDSQYWVLFASPLTVDGREVHGIWVDELVYGGGLDGAWTLGPTLAKDVALPVTGYSVTQIQ